MDERTGRAFSGTNRDSKSGAHPNKRSCPGSMLDRLTVERAPALSGSRTACGEKEQNQNESAHRQGSDLFAGTEIGLALLVSSTQKHNIEKLKEEEKGERSRERERDQDQERDEEKEMKRERVSE